MHRKNVSRSFCLALSFSHFLPNTFLPSWPASQFLLLPLSPPKSPVVKSAEASVFAARVMVITELRDHLREEWTVEKRSAWRKTKCLSFILEIQSTVTQMFKCLNVAESVDSIKLVRTKVGISNSKLVHKESGDVDGQLTLL